MSIFYNVVRATIARFCTFWFKLIDLVSLILANCLSWIFRFLHIVPVALHPCITAKAHPGKITPNGRGSWLAIHSIASCRTELKTNLVFYFQVREIGWDISPK